MSALAPIEAAIFARLLTLRHAGTPTNEAPFATVARYAGPLTREGLQAALVTYPCLLMKRGRVRPQLLVETTLHAFEQRAGDVWTLVIAVEDPREIDDAMVGPLPDVPGLLPLHDVVETTINGLALDALWAGRPVHVTEYGDLDALTARGAAYAAYLEVRADRSMQRCPTDDPPAEPFEGTDGGVNLPPDAPQPTAPFTANNES